MSSTHFARTCSPNAFPFAGRDRKKVANCNGRTVRGDDPQCRRRLQMAPATAEQHEQPEQPEQTSSSMDVSGAVVNPVFRSRPWAVEDQPTGEEKARILFVSESNVCRSVLAQAFMTQLVEEMSMGHLVACESKGSRDYNVGEGPEQSVIAAAEELSIFLPTNFKARKFDHQRDIVEFDLVLVMDKFTAADVLREVSVYDTIDKGGMYSLKVRRLGEFHPGLNKKKDPEAHDIEDPLYGNVGGAEEVEAVKKAANLIESSCIGLMEYLQGLQEHANDDPKIFRALLIKDIKTMSGIDWLVPPMLQKR